jgi:hypothetical protein
MLSWALAASRCSWTCHRSVFLSWETKPHTTHVLLGQRCPSPRLYEVLQAWQLVYELTQSFIRCLCNSCWFVKLVPQSHVATTPSAVISSISIWSMRYASFAFRGSREWNPPHWIQPLTGCTALRSFISKYDLTHRKHHLFARVHLWSYWPHWKMMKTGTRNVSQQSGHV